MAGGVGLVHVHHHTVADSGGVGSRGAVVCDLAQVADDTLTVASRDSGSPTGDARGDAGRERGGTREAAEWLPP